MISLLTSRLSLMVGIFVIFSSALPAQSVDEMFDDGGLSDPRGMVKLELLGLYSGDILVGYEHYLTEKFSLLVAAGPRLSTWKPNILLDIGGIEDLEIPDASGGFGLNAEARVYYSEPTKGVYNSLGYYLQNISRESGDPYRISIINFGIGYVLPITNRIHADATFYAGLRSFNDTAKQGFFPLSQFEREGQIVGGYNLKVGYLF